MRTTLASSLLALWASSASAQLDVDLTSADSIKTACATIAKNLISYYVGDQPGQTPGILPGPPPAGPYYWWEAGAMWGTYVDYWHYTGDTTYNNVTSSSLVFQAGAPQNSYMPPNWTASLGNDDQGFWGLSAMLAAEVTFPNPPSTDPQWLALAQAVFNTQVARWDTTDCNGGLRWQIPLSNNGYDYKNSIAQAILFNTGARLARYTKNDTYAQWAVTAYNWTRAVGYIDADWNVYDGGHIEHNCTDINKQQFSYSAAALIQGCGFMYNYTSGGAMWEECLTSLVNQTFNVFFPGGIMVERSCELTDRISCTADMLSYKGYTHRWLAQTTQMAPFMKDTIMPVLQTSAAAAAKNCNSDGTCGFRWTTASYDGDTGAGQEMNAFAALMSLLVEYEDVAGPVTSDTGGTSVGNPDAGADPDILTPLAPISSKDRAGAGVLTAVVIIAGLSIMVWMSIGDHEGAGWLEERGKHNSASIPMVSPLKAQGF